MVKQDNMGRTKSKL